MYSTILLTLFFGLVSSETFGHNNDEYAIHRACNHRYQFTRKELDDANNYLQTRFRNGAAIKPQKPACKSLKVIPDFRCISDSERKQYISALLKVYRNTDYIGKVSYIHEFYWQFVNIMAQTLSWHNKIQEDIQKQVEKFDPSVLMAYWDITTDATAPEKALVWDYFGHAGNEHNDYCVPDGPFSGLTLKYPNNTCLKRQWNPNGTINVWESPEVLTFMLQQSVGSLLSWGPLLFAEHFKKHVYIGGVNGDMGNVWATNEPIFYMHHWFATQVHVLNWQLEADNTLVDPTWGQFGRTEPPYSYNGTFVFSDIYNDTILGFNADWNATTLAEAMIYGFGDYCYVCDRIIESILGVLSNRRPSYPPAVQRLRDALPSDVFAQFFPLFANNTATQFNYYLPDVGNTNRQCKPLPVPLRYNQTVNGRRQLARFNIAGVDYTQFVSDGETKLYSFIDTLNKYHYCSPYVS